MRIVTDASAIVDAVLDGPRRDSALALLEGSTAYAPDLLDVEVLSAVARLERSSTITEAEAERAIGLFADIPIERIPSQGLIADVWPLRNALGVSDAFYIAAARILHAPLVTSDARLARAPLHGVTVSLIR